MTAGSGVPTIEHEKAETDFAGRLRTVVGRLSRRLNAHARGSGLTPSQLSALGVIAREGPLRLTELAAIESINPTMLSRVVGALDDAGLIRRKADPADRRAALIEVTPAGRRTHTRLRDERGRILAAGLESLDSQDRVAVEAALPALELLVEAIMRGTGPVA